MENAVKEFPITRFCAPIKIGNKKIGLLILAGCTILPVLAFSLLPNQIPNWLAVIIFLPVAVSMILLPFTGFIRKVVYAIPLTLILLVLFWPIAIYYLIKKFSNPQIDMRKEGFFPVVPWFVEFFWSWVLVAVGIILVVFFIIGPFIGVGPFAN